MDEAKWFLRTQDETFGPETEAKLLEWAKLGRVQPGQEISSDQVLWTKVEEVPFLDMRFSIDIGDGTPRGPFNRAAAEALLASGRLPGAAKMVEVREPFAEVKEPIAEEATPPVENVVEKVVEKVVVDETRVKELEGLLEEERRHSAKLSEQVVALEDELKRLPAAASEVADIQAAVFKIMQDEAAFVSTTLEREKAEFEEIRKRHQQREEQLSERRREILKMSGRDLEEMTRKALVERPEDPRTARLRRDYEDLRRLHEKAMLDSEAKIRQLTDQVRDARSLQLRSSESERDMTQMRAEMEMLRERLQRTEKDLVAERQRSEELRQREAMGKHVLLTRLAALESPSIGTTNSLETNQSREAKQVKLPSWMRLKH